MRAQAADERKCVLFYTQTHIPVSKRKGKFGAEGHFKLKLMLARVCVDRNNKFI